MGRVVHRLFVATVIASSTVASRADEGFLPAIEASKHSSSEWLAQFETDGCRSIDFLWCAHWAGDRSPAIIASLKALHERTTPEGAKVIETLLVDWGVDCSEWFATNDAPVPGIPIGDSARVTRGLGVLPFRMLDGTNDELLAALHGDDVWLRARAAITLAQRQSSTDEVVGTLVDALDRETHGAWPGFADPYVETISVGAATGLALDHVRAVTGTAFDAAVLRLVTDPATSDARRAFLLRQVDLAKPIDPASVDDRFLELATRADAIGWLARARLLVSFGFATSTWDWEPAAHDRFHESSNRCAFGKPDAERVLAEFLARELDRCARDGVWKQLVVENAGRVALTSTIVKDAVVPRLLPLVARDDATADEAMFALSHLDVDDPALRAAFVRRADAWIARGDTRFERVPCLVRHDRDSRAALARLFAATESKGDLALALLHGGCFGDPDDALARAYAAWADTHRSASEIDLAPWLPLAFDPSRFSEIPRRSQPYVFEAAADAQIRHGRSNDAQIAGLEAIFDVPYGENGGDGGGDYWQQGLYVLARFKVVTPRMVDRCFAILATSESFGSHQDGAGKVLANTSLDRAQQARLCRVDSLFDLEWGVRELLAQQGAASIERVAELRGDRLDDMKFVARITRLTPGESRILVRALEHGAATERVAALEIIETARFVDDAWRAPALARTSDVDVFVRRAATKLAAAKGW